MGILLIESSSKKISFGYATGGELVLDQTLSDKNNADTITYYINRSFREHSLSPGKIETVTLSNGPGSFTGLRIGSAIAKGICFANGSKLIVIPTLDVIANKYKSHRTVTSLIFSNQRTLEFYYCKFDFKDGVLNKLTMDMTGYIEDIINDDSEFVINGLPAEFSGEYKSKLIDVGDRSDIVSMYELSQRVIAFNEFSDYKTSKPFYMKEFVPKI